MILTTKLKEKFPVLAWIAIVTNEKIEVLHGEHVEARDNFFVEGAWSGEFNQGLFVTSNWFCGTGG